MTTDIDSLERIARLALTVAGPEWGAVIDPDPEDVYATDELGWIVHGAHEESTLAHVPDLSEFHPSASRHLAEHMAAASPAVVLELIAEIRRLRAKAKRAGAKP